MSQQITGTVLREDLGPGAWVLQAEDGTRYALKGGDRGLLREGQVVTVTGEVDDDAAGIGMTGAPVLQVERYTAR